MTDISSPLKTIEDRLSGSFGVSADATHPNHVDSEEEAMMFLKTARRGLALQLLHKENHEHMLDDCGDDLNHATELWQCVWESYFNNDGTDLMGFLNIALQQHAELWGHDLIDDEPEEREPYMTHSMTVTEQAIDELNARYDYEGLNDE